MKTLVLAIGLGACVLGLVYMSMGVQGDVPAIDRVGVESSTPSKSDVLDAPTAPAALDQTAGLDGIERVEVEAGKLAHTSVSAVFGRVVDGDGLGLPDVQVSLYGYMVWAEGSAVDWLEGSSKYKGFEMRTGADGEFRFEVPVPSNPRTYLRLKPDAYHDTLKLTFDSKRSQSESSLVAGERDMGAITLGSTGAIRGRVVDQNGQGLGGVKITTGQTRSSSFDRGATTEEDGAFWIQHARVGTYLARAKLEGYLSGLVDPVTVDAHRETAAVDFTLLPAPSLAGVVIDESGMPIEGAEITCWPLSDGSGAFVTTGVDGRFVAYLPQDEEYTVEAEHEDYAAWDLDGREPMSFMPGSSGIEIVLTSHIQVQARFTVVDITTKQPIEDFGLRIVESIIRDAPKELPQIERHIGGIAVAPARTEVDSYVIVADGYLPKVGGIFGDQPGQLDVQVRMDRGRAVRGRVIRGGIGVAGAAVELSNWEGRDSVTTDADGRFLFERLKWGRYRLEVTPTEGAPMVEEDVKIMDPDLHDLGDLVLQQGASVRGQVLLPAGMNPIGLSVVTGDWGSKIGAPLDEAGRFVFEDLEPGEYRIYLAGVPELLVGGAFVKVSLSEGENAEVTIDATADATCAVELQVEVEGLSAHGLRVSLLHTGTSPESAWLGTCDREGKVAGFARAWGAAQVRIVFPSGASVTHPDARLELTPGGKLAAQVSFSLTELRIGIPPKVGLPVDGSVNLSFEPIDARGQAQKVSFKLRAGSLLGIDDGAQGLVDGVLFSKALLPGSYTVHVEFKGRRPGDAPPASADGSTSLPDPVFFSGEYAVELALGKPAEIQL